MPVSVDLEASFSADGFDLTTAFSGLSALFSNVDLPTLDLGVSVSLDADNIDVGAIIERLGSVTTGLDTIVTGLPDLDALLEPVRLAMRVPELIAAFDLQVLLDQITVAVDPQAPGLLPLVEAAMSIGSAPLVGTLTTLLEGLGLDLSAPAANLGGAAGGVVALLQLLSALLAVESISRTIEERATLAADLLGAERLAGLVGRVRASGGIQLAGLLPGIDPDDPMIVELVAEPIEAYLGLVAELSAALVRGMAFAEATVVDADFAAQVLGLAVATSGLTPAALPPVRALVESAVPLVAPFLDIDVPTGGENVVFGAAAGISSQIEAAIDAVAPETIASLITPAIEPVLAPVRAIRQMLDEIAAVVGVVFDPIADALDAVDLEPVRAAIADMTDPVVEAVDAINGAVASAQSAIEDVSDAVHAALTPVRTTITETAATLTSPFVAVHDVIAALNLEELQATIRSTLQSVTDAISNAPVQPVFDIATGVIGTTADALGLVPKALLPDDLRKELEAACAPVEALDLEPTRAELHTQLATMIASIDASALDAVAAGYASVQEFVASVDPSPHVAALETAAFSALIGRLDALDPTALLAPVIEALATARAALAGVDLARLLAPVDAALDEIVTSIEGIDPTAALAPATSAIDEAIDAVRAALHLEELADRLDEVDTAVGVFLAEIPVADALDAVTAAWGDLVAGLRNAGPSAQPLGGVGRGLLAGLLPSVPVEGLPEVLAWVRDERDGSVVVRGRLERAAAQLAAATAAVGAIDVRLLTVELDAAHRALAAAVAAHPAESLLGARLTIAIGTTNPRSDLGRVVVNADSVKQAFAGAAATISVTTAPDRSEVQLTASGLGAAFSPLTPAVEKVRELAAFVGIDPTELAGAAGAQLALAELATRIGPEPIIGIIRSALTRLVARAGHLVHDGIVGPLKAAVAELTGLLDALSLSNVTERFIEVRDGLTALVAGLRPTVVLAAPLAAFDAVKSLLATFDPMGPARAVVDALKIEIASFATDLAPTTLLTPILTLHADITAAIATFDVAGLLEPVLAALREIGHIVDRGIDEVITALGRLKEACESEGGAIPGLDMDIAVSVDVSGGFGL